MLCCITLLLVPGVYPFMNTVFPSLKPLEIAQRTVAIDLQSGGQDYDVLNRLKDIANPITSQFHAISGAIMAIVNVRPSFFMNSRTESNKLKELNYLDITSIRAQVPEGLKVNLSVYQGHLVTATTEYHDIIKDNLTPFLHFLEDIITNKASISSVTQYSGVLKTMAVKREKFNTSFGTCFDTGSYETTRSFGEVYSSKNDYLAAIDQTEILNDWLSKVKTKEIHKLVARICEVLDTLVEQVNKEAFTDVSKTNLKYLADCAFEVGREVEFFALMVYRVQAVSASMNFNADKLALAMNR